MGMPRNPDNIGSRVLYPKCEFIYTQLTEDIYERFMDVVEESPFNRSEYVRHLIELELDKVKYYVPERRKEESRT